MEDPRTKSLPRLLEAAEEADPTIRGPAAIARALNTSDQVLTHWKKRGVPHAKTVAAQKLWGISAEWIATGEGEKWVTPPTSVSVPGPVPTSLEQARSNRERAWPFPRLDQEKIERLDQVDVISLETALLMAAAQLNLDVRKESADPANRKVV